jgi:hypothetical protein
MTLAGMRHSEGLGPVIQTAEAFLRPCFANRFSEAESFLKRYFANRLSEAESFLRRYFANRLSEAESFPPSD